MAWPDGVDSGRNAPREANRSRSSPFDIMSGPV